MDTNGKGNVGLGQVIADLTACGYCVFLPLTDTTVVDLVAADIAMTTKRLQVKYKEAKNGLVTIPLFSVVNGKRIRIDITKIDGWSVYCPLMDTDFDSESKSTFSFRVQPPKMVQSKMAPDGNKFIGAGRLWK